MTGFNYNSKDAEQFGQHKIFDHLDKIFNWINGKTETLVTAKVDMTNKCDSYCPGCVGGRIHPNASLTKEQSSYVIDQLSGLELKSVILSGGGEPLMNPHTPYAIEYAKSKGLDVGVITNGLRLDEKISEVISENCTWCRISVDADSPELYKKTHGVGRRSFERVIRNIESLCKTKSKMKSNCTIGAGYLTREDTIEGMVGFTKLSKELGVDYIQFRPFHEDFTPIDKQLERAKQYENKNFKIITSEQKYSRFNDENKRPYRECLSMNFIAVISADMKVYTCCHARGKEIYTIGDLTKESLREIWEQRKDYTLWEEITKNCPLFCEADTHNRVLSNIVRPKQHVNFI